MENVIKDFLATRKADRIKKKVSPNMAEEEKLLVEQEAEQAFLLDNWLPDAAKRAGQLSLVTHPGKFSHPSAKVSSILVDSEQAADGFLRSGNVQQVELDVFGNAAAIDVFKFLSLVLSDGKTILQHLELSSEKVRQELHIASASFEELRNNFLAIKQSDIYPQTSEKVKQVYFPVSENNYHLLSLLTPSGLVFKLSDRIQEMRFSEQTKIAKEAKKKKNYHEAGFADIYELTMIGYGGTKPQNISVLNNSHGGKAYLLPSLPPKFMEQPRLPKKDFFTDIAIPSHYKQYFKQLHYAVIKSGKKNKPTRDQRKEIIQTIITEVIKKIWAVRLHKPGWSAKKSHARLPDYQKIWLDEMNRQKRDTGDEWVDKVIAAFSRWFLGAYEKVLDKKAVRLDDTDMIHGVKNEIEKLSLEIVKENLEGLR